MYIYVCTYPCIVLDTVVRCDICMSFVLPGCTFLLNFLSVTVRYIPTELPFCHGAQWNDYNRAMSKWEIDNTLDS